MILDIRNLSKSYGSLPILQDVSFGIDKGQVFSLCGPSGSGKTTLVRIISGLLGFDEGQLVLGDTSVKAGTPYPNRLYGKVGVVFQEHNLFPNMTAAENIALALRKVRGLSKAEAAARAQQELERVELSSRADLYPSSLSGGERQRVAIGRAMAMDPLMLLLDEPTSGLDPLRIGSVLKIIRNLSENGTTMLLITHNLRFAREIGNTFGLIADAQLQVSDQSDLLNPLEVDWS